MSASPSSAGGSAPAKVLFIAGAGRSGSTILHNLLGQIDGFTAVGELRDIWYRGVLENWLCGCGVPFRECPMWHKVLDLAFDGVGEAEARRWYAATESFRTPHLPRTLIPHLRRRHIEQTADLRDTLGRLYAAISEVNDSRVIVDSSKNPSFGYLVAHVPGIEVRFLHFVRDAPAVAYSWSRHKEFEPGRAMARKRPAAAAAQWNARNAWTELFLGPRQERLQVRYEDFMEDPRGSLRGVLDWVGEPNQDVPFTSSHDAVLSEPTHSVFGNEVRFRDGPVHLRVDDRWRTEMPASSRRTVAAMSWPLRVRYGYVGGLPGRGPRRNR